MHTLLKWRTAPILKQQKCGFLRRSREWDGEVQEKDRMRYGSECKTLQARNERNSELRNEREGTSLRRVTVRSSCCILS